MKEEKLENWTAVFINTEDIPVETEPLHFYSYHINMDGKIVFWRLYRNWYRHPSGCINYPLDQWREITIKPHCQQAVINMIEGMKAVEAMMNR